jgi:outer membrane protein assembly factor BamB
VDEPVKFSAIALLERNGKRTIYAGTAKGYLHAIEDMGGTAQRRWRKKVGQKIWWASPSVDPGTPAGGHAVIYVGSTAGLSAVKDLGGVGDAQATLLWTFPTMGTVDTAAAILADGANRKLFVSSLTPGLRTLYALDPNQNDPTTGTPPKLLWKKEGDSRAVHRFLQTPSPVIDTNGVVYAGIGQTVYAFDAASSAEKWHVDLPSDVISFSLGQSPTTGKARLYVGVKNKMLYALEEP